MSGLPHSCHCVQWVVSWSRRTKIAALVSLEGGAGHQLGHPSSLSHDLSSSSWLNGFLTWWSWEIILKGQRWKPQGTWRPRLHNSYSLTSPPSAGQRDSQDQLRFKGSRIDSASRLELLLNVLQSTTRWQNVSIFVENFPHHQKIIWQSYVVWIKNQTPRLTKNFCLIHECVCKGKSMGSHRVIHGVILELELLTLSYSGLVEHSSHLRGISKSQLPGPHPRPPGSELWLGIGR